MRLRIAAHLAWQSDRRGFDRAALMLTRIAPKLAGSAALLCETKLSDNLGGGFLLAIFCNLLIFIAVDGFKHHSHEIGKYLGLFFGVVAFILCGFEHCVANMYFFTIGGVWSLRTAALYSCDDAWKLRRRTGSASLAQAGRRCAAGMTTKNA